MPGLRARWTIPIVLITAAAARISIVAFATIFSVRAGTDGNLGDI